MIYKMRKRLLILALLVFWAAILAIWTSTIGAQNIAPDPKIIAGLEDISLEKFETSEDWRARATCPLGETKILKTLQKGKMYDVFAENVKPLEDEISKTGKNYVLGVKTYFCEAGFDRVEVSPPHEYILTGKPRQFSIWVLGRNFNHILFIKLKDYRGKVHKLRMGLLNFFGWRKLTITVPGWLPQSSRYELLHNRLHFVSMFVVAGNHEVYGEFYFYVDNLRYTTDRTQTTYPGSEIKDNW